MCGINGLFNYSGVKVDRALRSVGAMNRSVKHRGPDDSGAWTTSDGRVLAADSKVTIDDNAAYRQQDLRD